MLLFPLAVGAGVLLGYLLQGRLRGLGQLRFQGFALVAAAAGVQVALPFAPPGWRAQLILVSYSLTGAWFLVNARQRPVGVRCGVLALAAGWALNLLPIALNGAMPVSSQAIGEISGDRGGLPHVDIRKHMVAGQSTRLARLGDVIPVVPLRSVVSVGDLLMAGGFAITVASAMAGGARQSVGAGLTARRAAPL